MTQKLNIFYLNYFIFLHFCLPKEHVRAKRFLWENVFFLYHYIFRFLFYSFLFLSFALFFFLDTKLYFLYNFQSSFFTLNFFFTIILLLHKNSFLTRIQTTQCLEKTLTAVASELSMTETSDAFLPLLTHVIAAEFTWKKYVLLAATL